MSWRWRLTAIAGSVLIPLTAVACGTRPYSPAAAGQSTPAPAQALSGPAGVDGAAVWAVSRNDVVLSQVGGETWSDLQLPEGVPASSIAAVSAAAGRDIWLAEPRTAGIDLFRRGLAGPASWSSTTLTSTSAPATPPDRVIISNGSAATVTVLEVWDLSPTQSLARLFVSSDNGASFTQLPAPDIALPYLGLVWWDASFSSATDGSAVVGANRDYILHTSDRGRTWSLAQLTGLPAGRHVALGNPILRGNDIELPVFTANPSSTGSETFSLFISRDGGSSFSQFSRPVTVAGSTVPGPVPVAVYGSTIWVLPAPGRELMHSANNGGTWNTVVLPFQDAAGIGSSGADSATVIAGGGFTCSGPKSNASCIEQKVEVWSTADEGQTWHNASPS